MAPNSCSIFAPETFTEVSPETRDKMEIYRTMRNRYGDRRSQAIKAEQHRIREIMLLGGEEEVFYLYDRLWNYVPPQKKNRKRKLEEVKVDDEVEKEGATNYQAAAKRPSSGRKRLLVSDTNKDSMTGIVDDVITDNAHASVDSSSAVDSTSPVDSSTTANSSPPPVAAIDSSPISTSTTANSSPVVDSSSAVDLSPAVNPSPSAEDSVEPDSTVGRPRIAEQNVTGDGYAGAIAALILASPDEKMKLADIVAALDVADPSRKERCSIKNGGTIEKVFNSNIRHALSKGEKDTEDQQFHWKLFQRERDPDNEKAPCFWKVGWHREKKGAKNAN